MTYRKLIVMLVCLCVLVIAVPAMAQDSAQDSDEEERNCPAFEGASADVRRSYYMGEGFAFVSTGSYSSALHSYSCIIEQIAPNYIDAYLNRAIVHTLRRSYDLAIEDYTTAIEINAAFAPAYLNRGVAHMARQEFEDALADFDRAIDIDGDYSYAYNNRGVLHASQGDYEAAVADFRRVIDIENLDDMLALRQQQRQAREDGVEFTREIPEYNVRLARVYALLGMIDVQYALQDLDDYLLLAGSSAENRIENATGALSSRFEFDLRFDSTWIFAVDFIGDE